jgi:hypothetical protein
MSRANFLVPTLDDLKYSGSWQPETGAEVNYFWRSLAVCADRLLRTDCLAASRLEKELPPSRFENCAEDFVRTSPLGIEHSPVGSANRMREPLSAIGMRARPRIGQFSHINR